MDNLKFTFKEMIMLGGWLLSCAGLYYTMNAKVEALKLQVGSHNLDLIEYKLQEVNAKTDRVLLILTASDSE
jgi:hypothetical protein